MKTKARSRCAVKAARWASYAAAAAATAVLANNDTEAAIFYSGSVGDTISGAGNHIATLKTLISNSSLGTRKIARMSHSTGQTPSFPPPPEKAFHAKFRPLVASNNAHARGVLNGAVAYASNLAMGAPISGGHFVTTANKVNAMADFVGTINGASDGRGGTAHGDRQWTAFDITGFLGFEFNLGAGEQYGWVRVKTTNNYKYTMTLVDYAYGTPGQAITAGQETAAPGPWTGASSGAWSLGGNWTGGTAPGATSGTTSTATALFELSVINTAVTVDSGRNVMNMTFDTAAVSPMTIGTAGGNPLLLTSGGTVQTTSVVASPEVVNAPLTLEGNYTFSSNATNASDTLSFGGGIHPAATSGTTTLTLNGTNTGSNTISGILADNGAGHLALSVGGTGVWVLNGSTSTFSGGTTIASGATLELAGSVSALGLSQNISNSGSLVAEGGNQTVGTVLGTGNTSVTSGTLTAYQIRQNSLTIGSGAAVTLVPSGSGSTSTPALPNNINFSSSLTSLSIASSGGVYTGTLDIGNNGLVIAYGNPANDPYTTIDKMIEAGYNGGYWTSQPGSTGITSTLAGAAVTMHLSTPLNVGLVDFTPGVGQAYSNTTFIVFEGQTITTNAILVRLTYMDDLVLAGDMSQNDATSDALLFAANYGTGTTWAVGDLVHDGGPIGSSDALLFAANYATGLPSLDGSSGGAVALGSGEAGQRPVPEPATVGLLALGALGLLVIRRDFNFQARPAKE